MPIRDIVVIAIVVVAALMALKRGWIGVMLWTWVSMMSPHRYTWSFAYAAPVAAIAGAATLIGFAFSKEKQSPLKGAPVAWLLLFTIWITMSWLMGVDVQGDYPQWSKVIKVFLMIFVALSLLHNRYHILALAWITIMSLALLGLKGGLWTAITGGGGRVWGPPGSFIADNNEFGLALVVTIPLIHFLQLQSSNRWLRHFLSTCMLFCFAAALGTHSRGALVAMSAMGAMFWLRSNRKGLIGILIFVAIVVILPMMPEEWWNRMATIETYQEDGSAMGRINAWGVALAVAQHNFFGGGMSYQYDIFFYAYGIYETIVRAAHSIYFQVLGNHGFIGLFLFLGMWISSFRTAGWLRKNARKIPEARWAADLGSMIQVGYVGYAVGGAFLSLAYYDLPYNMMVMAVLARVWVETKGWERDPAQSFLEYAGIRKVKKGSLGIDANVSR